MISITVIYALGFMYVFDKICTLSPENFVRIQIIKIFYSFDMQTKMKSSSHHVGEDEKRW